MAPSIYFDESGWTVAEELGEGWVALYRFVLKNGRPVVTAVHAFFGGDEVSAVQQVSLHAIPMHSEPDAIPPGGLTSRRLGMMRPYSAFERLVFEQRKLARSPGGPRFAAGMKPIDAESEELAELWAGAHSVMPKRRDERLLLVAALYVIEVAGGARDTNKHIAAKMGRTAAQVRDDVRAARRDGLLTPGIRRGYAGGRLTSKAMGLIKEGLARD